MINTVFASFLINELLLRFFRNIRLLFTSTNVLYENIIMNSILYGFFRYILSLFTSENTFHNNIIMPPVSPFMLNNTGEIIALNIPIIHNLSLDQRIQSQFLTCITTGSIWLHLKYLLCHFWNSDIWAVVFQLNLKYLHVKITKPLRVVV